MTVKQVKLDFFIGNDWDVHRTAITSRGVLIGAGAGMVARALISATPHGPALDPSLEIAELDWLADGEVIGTIQGSASEAVILPLWDAANGKLSLYERVIVDDADYQDVVELVIARDRPPNKP